MGSFSLIFLLLLVLVLNTPVIPPSLVSSGGRTSSGDPALPDERLMLSLDIVGVGLVVAVGVVEPVFVVADSIGGSVGMLGSVGPGEVP